MAEKAAWEFLEKQKPNFTLSTMCPPLVLGPIGIDGPPTRGVSYTDHCLVHYLNSLDALNTSNQRIRDMIVGKSKEEIPPTGVFLWTDVRDVALAHVKAIELPEAANKRFFITTGYFSNKEIVEIVREAYPDLELKLPSKDTKGGDYPDGIYKYDNSRAVEVLGLEFRPLKESIVDTVKSLQAVGA